MPLPDLKGRLERLGAVAGMAGLSARGLVLCDRSGRLLDTDPAATPAALTEMEAALIERLIHEQTRPLRPA